MLSSAWVINDQQLSSLPIIGIFRKRSQTLNDLTSSWSMSIIVRLWQLAQMGLNCVIPLRLFMPRLLMSCLARPGRCKTLFFRDFENFCKKRFSLINLLNCFLLVFCDICYFSWCDRLVWRRRWEILLFYCDSVVGVIVFCSVSVEPSTTNTAKHH